ncbi:glycosyltransferase [Thiobacillus denitrificans]|nr:glycosyltransferase [Thiobacillus denitrificans]
MLIEELSTWEPLKTTLKGLAAGAKGAPKYIPNQGNAGDALIAAGSWQFFEDCQIAPHFASTRSICAGDTVIYSGGGNLVPEYDNCRNFLERCLEVGVARALVLPHSIRGHQALLQRLDSRFTLVCRDLASLQRVKATGTQAEVMFAPDMALYIDVERLFAQCRRYQGLRLWAQFVRNGQLYAYQRWRAALKRLRPAQAGSIAVMRADAEATLAEPGDPRGDVPSFYGSQYSFREESDLVSRDLLGLLKPAERVRTNRLHVGVAAALVGCEVTYRDNSYGKIRALYDAWLSHLPSVRFEGETGRTPRFSLIMGTLGRTEEVGRFLASLQRQEHRDFELFIVDQNPDDRLLPLIEKYSRHFRIERVVSPKGLSRARNAGLQRITGDLVAFPDDDCWYPDGLLSYVASRFKLDSGLDGLTGRFVDEDGRAEGRWLARSQVLNRYTVWRGAISFSIFLRRSLVDRIEPFDEALGVGAGTAWGAGEETDYLLRSLNAGGRIVFDHELVLRHPVKTGSFDEAARERQGRYESGFGRVIRRSGFPFWYFPWVCLRTLTGALLALCTGRPAQARFKWHSVQSRIRGWLTGAGPVA